MSRLRLLAALAVALWWASPVAAAPTLEDYAAPPDMVMVQLSPSGERFAYVGLEDGQRRLFVYTVSGDPIRKIPLSSLKLESLQWAGDDHLVATFKADIRKAGDHRSDDLTEVFVFNPVTGQSFWVFKLGKSELAGGAVYGQFGFAVVDGHWTGLFLGISRSGTRIFRVNLDTGEETPLTGRFPSNIQQVTFDASGRVVALSKYEGKKSVWSVYSRSGEDDQKGEYSGGQLIAEKDDDPLGLSSLYRGPRPGSVIYQTGDSAASTRIFEVGLAPGSTPVELLPGREIISFITDRQKQITLGAELDDKPYAYEFFDPKLRASFKAVEKALAGRNPQLESWSSDFNRLVVLTQGDNDAGTYWLVDIKQGRADILGTAREGVKPEDINEIRMFPYKAADGLALEGVLTLPKGREPRGLPLIVLPHDPYQTHDIPKFDWMTQALSSQGYAVFQPNFRGSTGYGEAVRNAGFGQWGRKMQTDVSDGVAALARQDLIDPGRVCIMGVGQGGYMSLVGVTAQQGVYRCAVAVSALTDLNAFASSWYYGRRSSSAVRFWAKYLGVDGSRSAESVMKDLSPTSLARSADAPILLIYGKLDSKIPPANSIRMHDALQAAKKPVSMVVIPGEGETIELESDRLAVLQNAVTFIMTHNPPR